MCLSRTGGQDYLFLFKKSIFPFGDVVSKGSECNKPFLFYISYEKSSKANQIKLPSSNTVNLSLTNVLVKSYQVQRLK